jgi:nitrate reductase gamma subunit
MRSLAGIAVALWLGVMGFFAFVVAPAAFTALDREAAGRFVGAVFPRYYVVGAVLGSCALVALIAQRLRDDSRHGDWLLGALVLAMLALTLYAWLAVLPAAQAAKEAMRRASSGPGEVEALSFSRLHRLSTILNGAVMLAGTAFVVLDVVRRP